MSTIKPPYPPISSKALGPGYINLSIRNALLSMTLATAIALSGNSFAENASLNNTEIKTYHIPAGPLGRSLSNFAVSAGIPLSFDSTLTDGLTSPGISGEYSQQQVLDRLLAGSGLTLSQKADGSFTLYKTASAETNNQIALPAVIVSGEKINRRLQDTLSSVAVYGQEDIRQHADQDLQNIMARTPGLYTQSGNENWGIRGVPVSGFDSQGAGTMNGAVTVFVDGAAQTHRLVTMNPLRLWDVEQVEVYRGAQSTTQGRNSLAGAVVLKTKDPTFQPEFAAQTNFGSYGEQGISFVANDSIVDNLLAGRLAVDYQTIDGYIKNETLDRDGDAQRAVNIRGKLLFQPSEKMDLLLTLDRTEQKRGANTVSVENGKPRYYDHFLNTAERDALDQNTASAKLDYYLSDNWTFSSLSSGTWSNYDSLLDFDQTVTLEREAVRKHKQDLLSQEFRFTYESERLLSFFGLYYAKHSNDIDDRINLNLGGFDDPALISQGDIVIRNQAIFGEVNWEFIDNWTWITGMRLDHEKNNTKFQYVDPLGLATVESADENNSFTELLPKVGLSHRLNQNHLIGLTWQKGYRGGGVDLSTSTAHRPYDPEYTSTYELAWRGSWLANRLNTNLNIYHTDWKDQQVEISDELGIATVANAAKSRMKGLELSADFLVNSAFTLFAGASYNHTRYLDFNMDGNDLSGQQFPFAPEYKVSLGGSYRFINGLRVSSDIVYQSDSITLAYTNGVASERDNDSVTLVNLNGEYPLSKNLTVSAFVRNLLDREYITNNQNDNFLDVGAPRTFGIALRAEM